MLPRIRCLDRLAMGSTHSRPQKFENRKRSVPQQDAFREISGEPFKSTNKLIYDEIQRNFEKERKRDLQCHRLFKAILVRSQCLN